MYKILVSAMAYDQGKSGISDYMNNVINGLADTNHVDVLILNKDSKIFPRRSPNLNFLIYPDYLAVPVINMFWHLYVLPRKLDFSRYDFVFLPAGNRRLFCQYPRFTVSTFHDLSQFHMAGKYDFFRTLFIKYLVPHYLRKVDRICAVSQSTKTDIINYYKIPGNKIIVNYNGYDAIKLFSSESASPEEIREKFNINKKYMLYVARIETSREKPYQFNKRI